MRHFKAIQVISLSLFLVVCVLAPGRADGYSQGPSEKVTIGTISQVGERDFTIQADEQQTKFVITPTTKMPSAGLATGKRTRVFYIASDVLVATRVELID